jgi:hypothetical protein
MLRIFTQMKIIRSLVGAACLGLTISAANIHAQNVGIDVPNPQSKLSVNGTTSSGGLAIGDTTYTSTAGTIAPTNGALIEGNVGIGLTTPQVPLHVNGSIWVAPGSITGNFWNGTANIDGSEIDLYGLIASQRSSGADLSLAKPASFTNPWFTQLIVNNNTIGTIAVDASGTSTDYNTTSDIRLKENIRPTAKGLNDLMRIQVSDFSFKLKPGTTETGFIAQQLYTVLPEVVTQGGTDPSKQPWMVDYGRVTPLLARAIQEQQGEIETLKQQATKQEAAFRAENAELKAENAKLETQNTDLREANQKLAQISAQMEALQKALAIMQGKDKDRIRTAVLQ